MKDIPISEFRAECFRILEQVRKTRQPICVTGFGRPIAEVRAIPLQRRRSRRLGSMAGTARILGDIVGPTGSLGDWEAWRD